MELALEAGAEDFKVEEEGYEILAAPNDFEAVHKAVETAGIAMESAEITALPEMTAPISSEADLGKVDRLVDLLEDHDDVQEVYSNAELQ
jgi:transcriptional/translational regulatory protein YebC/TACO1